MPSKPAPVYNAGSGRRGYYIYEFGTHIWVPIVDGDWSHGIIRDVPRASLPPGSVYDSTDYLLHQPGIAQKRGGTSYAGPALTSATYTAGVAFAPFPGGGKLLGIGNNGHLYTVASGSTSDISTMGSAFATVDTPKFRVGASKNLLVITANDGSTAPMTYDGTTVATLTGSPAAGKFAEIYKTRLVVANTSGNPNRLFFSPTPDITATWDTTDSWIDANYPVTGMAALTNVLLIFSAGHTERIIGTTPPPGSDMDLATLFGTGCTDARSIVVMDGQVIFANQNGVYLTNGAGILSLTAVGGIATYWQALLAGYDATTWTIAAGVSQSTYLTVSITDNNGALVDTLMCNLAAKTRSWWRVKNYQATMFARSVGVQDELYYADRTTNRVTKTSGMWTPTGANKNDANGTAVTPTIEFRPLGTGTGMKQFGYARATYDMRDAATDNPTLAITVKPGIEADTAVTPAESPLVETTSSARQRFSVMRSAQAVTVKLTQANASAKTEIYALELEERIHSLTAEGTG